MKNYILLFSLLIGLFFSSIINGFSKEPINPTSLFHEANKLYRSGNYKDAAIKFEEIIKAGYKNSSVYYNLGNCYFKQQEIPNAILNFEKAKKLNPNDDDIIYNLKMSYANTIDKIEPVPQLFYQRWWSVFLSMFSPTIWATISITLFWISAGLAIFYLVSNSILGKKISFLFSGLILICSLFLFGISSCSNNTIQNNNSAIVMETSAYIKSSPDNASTNLFMLHGGTRIEIVDKIKDWKKIKIANGNMGWIREEFIEEI